MIDLDSFETLLDRHGGDLAAWPQRERLDAEVLLAASPEARAAKRDMDVVEAVLRRDVSHSVGGNAAEGDVSGLAAAAMRRPQAGAARPTARRTARHAAWGAAMAAALMLGLIVGDSFSGSGDESPDQVVASVLGPTSTFDVD